MIIRITLDEETVKRLDSFSGKWSRSETINKIIDHMEICHGIGGWSK